jgi:AraC-like DNA-binding protein
MTRKTFTREHPTCPMNYPGFVFRALREEGYDANLLLAGTGLTEADLYDPDSGLAFEPLRRFINNALTQTNDPHLGVRLAQRFEASYIGLPAYTAMSAAQFGDALTVLSRFMFLAFTTIEFSVVASDPAKGGDEVAVRLRPMLPLGDIAYFMSASALVVCNELFKTLLRRPSAAVRAEMMAPEPAGWADIAPALGFPVVFEAPENRLVLSAALLAEPLPGADPLNHSRLLSLCEKYAAESGFETTPRDLVVAFLESEGNLGAPLSQAAMALGYSERGLRRRLEQSGTSYRRLLEEVRVSRARDMLVSSNKAISEIAHELGYDSPSNFARSFKRSTGMTPKAFRGSPLTR